MSISGVNSMISLQESQLIQMLQQQAAKARADAGARDRQAQVAGDGQNLPGTDNTAGVPADAVVATDGVDVPPPQMDPALSPENINALLVSLQTQQASLETTLMLGGSSTGPGGKTLVDYLTNPNSIGAAANDDAANAFGMMDTLS
jgi:hypothetical protein